ncbi:TPA: hypothetical protein ACWLXD_004493, partial [Citrobacter freundii]
MTVILTLSNNPRAVCLYSHLQILFFKRQRGIFMSGNGGDNAHNNAFGGGGRGPTGGVNGTSGKGGPTGNGPGGRLPSGGINGSGNGANVGHGGS